VCLGVRNGAIGKGNKKEKNERTHVPADIMLVRVSIFKNKASVEARIEVTRVPNVNTPRELIQVNCENSSP
jgi:hypothetical protein